MTPAGLAHACSLAALLACPVAVTGQAGTTWPTYGGDAGGSRFSALAAITPSNIADLTVAWTYRTGEADRPEFRTRREPRFETTPLMVDGTLYLSTPLGRVIALDPATGAERWTFDPEVPRDGGYGDFTNRGVAYWRASGAEGPCTRRIFIATIDARLIALDAGDGTPCAAFGTDGEINLREGLRIPPFEFEAYQVTSPPLVIGDLVITGSAIADNTVVAPASGEVRAWDARTGTLRWSWDPIPQDPADPAHAGWAGAAARTGGANVWSVMVADPRSGLIFVPTSSPAPDYFGGLRPGDNRYGNALVALRAATGEVAWHFQTVHHDLWDYDNASPPALATIVRDGRRVPVVLQATKTGQLFVLRRDTGAPVFPVEERPVPASDVPGEIAWPTQPFSAIPPLSPHALDVRDAWGPTPDEADACYAMMAGLRNEGIFTPPSTGGTLAIPSNVGGAHWGGVAVDPQRFLAVVPVNRFASAIQLIPMDSFDESAAAAADERLGVRWDYTPMRGTPWVMRRRILTGPSGQPCSPPPWGALVAVNLNTGTIRWNVPLGTAPGLPNLGGPLLTASGLVFMAGTPDQAIRAYDVETGRVLWTGQLPGAGARATPMTYQTGGRQFVVISAGGGQIWGRGDHVVAFALPQ